MMSWICFKIIQLSTGEEGVIEMKLDVLIAEAEWWIHGGSLHCQTYFYIYLKTPIIKSQGRDYKTTVYLGKKESFQAFNLFCPTPKSFQGNKGEEKIKIFIYLLFIHRTSPKTYHYLYLYKHTHTQTHKYLHKVQKAPTCMAFNELVMFHWPHYPCKSPHCFIKVLDFLGIPPFHYYRENKTQPCHREYKNL